MRVRTAVAATLLAVMAALNALTFGATDAEAPEWWRALHRFDEPDPLVAALSGSDRLRTRLDVAVALGSVAPGSTVMIPGDDHGVWDRHALRLAGFGDADVRWIGGDDSWAEDVSIDAAAVMVASGDEGPLGPAWRILVASEALADPVPADSAPGAYVEALLEGQDVARATAPVTFLALLSPDGTQLVLVDVRLASVPRGGGEPWS